ncbi:MAG: helix-turn-helix domain-containing protein, partial [Clostridia bacterium]|nr:helix-turn-helix domain-containing protein [Clostridia bacterium]
AKRLGVSKVTYWKWENGKAEPKHSQFQKLCEECGVEAQDIFLPKS